MEKKKKLISCPDPSTAKLSVTMLNADYQTLNWI